MLSPMSRGGGGNERREEQGGGKRMSMTVHDGAVKVRRKHATHTAGCLDILFKLYQGFKPYFEKYIVRFVYDTTKNNWLGADIYCLDKRIFGTCIVHDEVRLGSWMLFVSVIVCFVVFVTVHSFLQNVRDDSLDNHPHFIALMISLPFCILATLLTVVQVINHHRNWHHKASQRQIVRIVMMCPIYAWAAWFSLYYLSFSVYIDFIRVAYEAYVIYSFLLLLTKYLGGRDSVALIIRNKPPLHWPAPLCCLPDMNPDKRFILRMKYGVLQYVLIAPLLALSAGVLNWFNAYGDGEVDWTKGYAYVIAILNCSQLVSLYCLIWFYMVTANELLPFNPVAKFLVVKAVVFFTFWQSVSLALAVQWGWIQGTSDFSTGEIQVGLQNFIICIEMFITAIVHRYTFGHEDYANGALKLIMETRVAMWRDLANTKNKENKTPPESVGLEVGAMIAADAVQASTGVVPAIDLYGRPVRPDDDEFEGTVLIDEMEEEPEAIKPMKAEEVLGISSLRKIDEENEVSIPVKAFDFSSLPVDEKMPAKSFK